MNSGFIYVLTNECMPGLVKVGKTKRLPTDRSSELFTTGVATPFQVKFALFVEDMDAFEKDVHAELADIRVNSSREFFSIESDDVIVRILKLFARDFQYEVQFCDMVMDQEDIERYSDICGVNSYEVRQVINCLPVSAWKAGVARWQEWIEGRRRERQQRRLRNREASRTAEERNDL